MSRVLAIDIGSSSVRAAVYAADGREVDGTSARSEYSLETHADGGVDVAADSLVERVAGCIDHAIARVNGIVAVGVSCFWHSLVAVDASNRAVTPVLTWADTRARGQARALRAELDEHAVHERTGARLHASYLPAKLRFLEETAPELFRSETRWMSFAEYLFLTFFGEPSCSVSMASATGLFNHRGLDWDAELCTAIRVPTDRLTPISDAPSVKLRPAWSSRWPVLSSVPWYPAIGDGACANIGSGCASGDRIGLTIGTSAAMRVVSADAGAARASGLWRYRVDGRRVIVGGALSEGGGTLMWLRQLLGRTDSAADERDVAALGPDAHGLTILPFPSGERSPGWAADARMTISGLSVSTRPVDILRATLESVAYRLKLIADQLSTAVPADTEVVGSGGALLASPAWAAIVADVLGRTVRFSAEPEAACRGAALLALERAGVIRDAADVPAAMGAAFEPDEARHRGYLDAIERQQSLYRLLVPNA